MPQHIASTRATRTRFSTKLKFMAKRTLCEWARREFCSAALSQLVCLRREVFSLCSISFLLFVPVPYAMSDLPTFLDYYYLVYYLCVFIFCWASARLRERRQRDNRFFSSFRPARIPSNLIININSFGKQKHTNLSAERARGGERYVLRHYLYLCTRIIPCLNSHFAPQWWMLHIFGLLFIYREGREEERAR